MKTVTGKLVFEDIGPGHFELQLPTITYRLVPESREILDFLRTSHASELETVSLDVEEIGDIAHIGGTYKQTLRVHSVHSTVQA